MKLSLCTVRLDGLAFLLLRRGHSAAAVAGLLTATAWLFPGLFFGAQLNSVALFIMSAADRILAMHPKTLVWHKVHSTGEWLISTEK